MKPVQNKWDQISEQDSGNVTGKQFDLGNAYRLLINAYMRSGITVDQKKHNQNQKGREIETYEVDSIY